MIHPALHSSRFTPRWARPLLLAAVVALAGLSAARADDPVSPSEADVEAGMRALAQIEAAVHRAIERAQPSVVSVFFRSAEPAGRFTIDPLRRSITRDLDLPQFASNVYGSGIIVDRKGFVLTCYHVVRPAWEEKNLQLVVVDHAGKEYPARVHAADPRSDLAVLQLQGKVRQDLPAISIGDGSNLFRGQFVLAVGNPFGIAADGSISASWGIISNIRRRPAIPAMPTEEERFSLHQAGTLIQTDARLNMGISGGALLNLRGELVGVTMAMAAATGLETPGGFALPTDELTRRTIQTLVDGREVEYGFLGVQPQGIDPVQAAQRGYPPVEGVYVETAVSYLPAARAGIRPGDIIVSINGKPITNPSELILLVGSLPVGAVLDAEVVRLGRPDRLNLKLPLAKYPVRGEKIVTVKRPQWKGIRVDHLSVLAGAYALPDPRGGWEQGGVVVSEVDENSPAFEKGIRPGLVITRVNGKAVYTPEEFEREVRAAKPPVRLRAWRDQEYVFDDQASPAKPDDK